MSAAANAGSDARAGKYLTFVLANEEYGFEILKVREIIGMMDVTRVPSMPAYVLGVINLRGRVIPVVDLRQKFGMPAAAHTGETCIIIVSVQNQLLGVVVDRVSEVLDISGAEIEDAPEVGSEGGSDAVLGMAKTRGGVKILLGIDAVLAETVPQNAAA